MHKTKFYFTAALIVIATLAFAGCTVNAPTESANVQAATPAETATAESAAGAHAFQEFPIGDEVEADGINIAAIYLKPVDMEPAMKAGLSADKADIHLEADISALKDNPYGFGAGEFVPYLTVNYQILDDKGTEVLGGSFMPMNAGDGSHYGINVKMPGAGNYTLKYLIESPEKQDFLLHTDAETGVPRRFWKKPIEAEFEFVYIPRKF